MNNLPGSISVFGLPGAGKTTFALTYAYAFGISPDDVYFLDLDGKGPHQANQFGYKYNTLPETQVIEEGDSDVLVDNLLEKTKSSKVVIFDNFVVLEHGFKRMVENDPKAYNVRPMNIVKGIYGSYHPGITVIWSDLVTKMFDSGVETIWFLAHVSAPWVNGAPVLNKFKPLGNKALERISSLRTVLISTHSAPIALVAKSAYVSFDSEKMETRRMFPPKMTADWKKIKSYMENGWDIEAATKDEIPTQQELSIYNEFFSKEQIEMIKIIKSWGETEVSDVFDLSTISDMKNLLKVWESLSADEQKMYKNEFKKRREELGG